MICNGPAKHIDGYEQLETNQICYWRGKNGWMLYIPSCGIGCLSAHTIEEHEDGTITASPSVMMTGHNEGQPITVHGYLKHGEWTNC